MRKPKAIVFDYGDTLLKIEYFRPVDGTREVLKYANNPKNVTAEEVQGFADEVLNDIGAFEVSAIMQIDGKALTRLIHSVHGVSFDKSFGELDAIFLDAAQGTSLMPGLADLLEYLQEQGIRLAVLSNTGFCENSHRIQLRKYDIEKYFEFFMATSDYLIRKPDKRIFDVALAKLELDSDDVWYVGNKFEFDVQGAHDANMFPVWINVEDEEPHDSIEHLSVGSYNELLEVLKNQWYE